MTHGGTSVTDQGLRSLVLREVRPGNWVEPAGWSYRAWFTEVHKRAKATIETAVPGLFELGQFLAGYFGEDWQTRGSEAAEVLANSLDVTWPGTINAVVDQLDDVLGRPLSEDELKALVVNELGSRYSPEPEHRTYRAWLHMIRFQGAARLGRPVLLADGYQWVRVHADIFVEADAMFVNERIDEPPDQV